MKKFILTSLLTIISIFGFSQYVTNKDSVKNDRLMASVGTTLKYTLNTPRLQAYYQPSNYVGINLRVNTSPYYGESDRKTAFVGIFIAGLAFTTAAILESGDFKIYQGETARQIMLGVGIGLTLTGGIGAISK